jgi:hypothetical protein
MGNLAAKPFLKSIKQLIIQFIHRYHEILNAQDLNRLSKPKKRTQQLI